MSFITIIGFIAAFCTTMALLPQVVEVVETKKTKDLSLTSYLITSIGIFLWAIYGFLINDKIIIFANAITFLFAFTILFYKIKYK
jgi:MtN3 and saliva related transmembrane protein